MPCSKAHKLYKTVKIQKGGTVRLWDAPFGISLAACVNVSTTGSSCGEW